VGDRDVLYPAHECDVVDVALLVDIAAVDDE
jgi:hypothetical protein